MSSITYSVPLCNYNVPCLDVKKQHHGRASYILQTKPCPLIPPLPTAHHALRPDPPLLPPAVPPAPPPPAPAAPQPPPLRPPVHPHPALAAPQTRRSSAPRRHLNFHQYGSRYLSYHHPWSVGRAPVTQSLPCSKPALGRSRRPPRPPTSGTAAPGSPPAGVRLLGRLRPRGRLPTRC